MRKIVCFLDLDGVLVDFVAGALEHHEAYIPPTEIQWGFNTQIGLTESDFWKTLGYDFWVNLKWTAEGKDLLAGVETRFGKENIVILTSPCATPGGVEGKVDWIRRELPAYTRQNFIGSCKHLAAGPWKFLIDDNTDNIQMFKDHGGHGLLVPRPWNIRKRETNEFGHFDVHQIIAELA